MTHFKIITAPFFTHPKTNLMKSIEMMKNYCSPLGINFRRKKENIRLVMTGIFCSAPSFLISSYYSILVCQALLLCSGVPIIMVITETDIRWVSLE